MCILQIFLCSVLYSCFLASVKHEPKPIATLGDLIKEKLKKAAEKLSCRNKALVDVMDSVKVSLDNVERSHAEHLSTLHCKRDEHVGRSELVFCILPGRFVCLFLCRMTVTTR